MKSNEQQIGEAVAALRARLDQLGVENAADIAHTYVHDMLRNGWRPRATPTYSEPTQPTERATREHVAACVARAKASITKGPQNGAQRFEGDV